MKEFSSKRIALKVDVIEPENILFAARPCILQHGNFTSWGSEGVNCVVHIKTAIACQCLARIIADRRVNKRTGLHPARDSCDS